VLRKRRGKQINRKIQKWSVLSSKQEEKKTFLLTFLLWHRCNPQQDITGDTKAKILNQRAWELIDERCNMVRGKALGGTSVVNFLLHTRGNRLDFDSWANMGNYGWSYKDVLPLLHKIENCTLCRDIDKEFHGTNGYLNIEHPGYESHMVKLFLKAGRDLGIGNNDPNGNFGLATVLLRPKSKGRIFIRNSNPFPPPVIKPNYFENDGDVATMVEGIKWAISVATSKHFKKYNSYPKFHTFPRLQQIPFGTDQYWSCAVRHVSTTLGHHSGTCKMGPKNDPDAVVDPQLSVWNSRSTGVVDGSIMPNIVAGHTNAVIYMIGEKASDLIKASWEDT
ncbi:hypothetical protein NQ317_005501, partial [Molorchus minor]